MDDDLPVVDGFLYPLTPEVTDDGMDDGWLGAPITEDDDDDDDSWVIEPYPNSDDEEEFYELTPQELSCCWEEWEEYC